MVSQAALDAAIHAALATLAAELGTEQPRPNGRGGLCLRDGETSLGVLGVPRTQEIEWWLDTPDPDIPLIRSEIVQEWLGEPVRAYQFNDANFAAIAAIVSGMAKHVLVGLRDDEAATLRALADADARLGEQSRLARIRPEANRAWEQGDYALAKKLYRSIASSLTPAETKRLEIAERKTAALS